MNKVRCTCGEIFDVEPLTYTPGFNGGKPINRLYVCKCGKRYWQKPTTHVFATSDSFISEDMPKD